MLIGGFLVHYALRGTGEEGRVIFRENLRERERGEKCFEAGRGGGERRDAVGGEARGEGSPWRASHAASLPKTLASLTVVSVQFIR